MPEQSSLTKSSQNQCNLTKSKCAFLCSFALIANVWPRILKGTVHTVDTVDCIRTTVSERARILRVSTLGHSFSDGLHHPATVPYCSDVQVASGDFRAILGFVREVCFVNHRLAITELKCQTQRCLPTWGSCLNSWRLIHHGHDHTSTRKGQTLLRLWRWLPLLVSCLRLHEDRFFMAFHGFSFSHSRKLRR